MQKIVVNTRLLRKDEMDGIGWFTFNTLKRITTANPDIEFHFLFDSGIENEFIFSENIVPKNLFPPAKHAILNRVWFEWSVKNYLTKVNPDLFLSPDGILCLGWKGKQYGVIHDINFVHIPEDLKKSNRRYYNDVIPKSARKAARLGTVSEYSKNDIVNTFGIDASKVDVLYNGINSFFEPVNEDIRAAVKNKYTAGKEFFLFVGTLHPRKNILRLLEAFELFKSSTGSDLKLLITGKEMYRTDEMHQFRDKMRFKEDVLFTGPLASNELNRVFGSAFCLTYVPYFEGFGIPLVEAMQCEVPILAAKTTSLPEIAGDAALYVDPYIVKDIAAGMERIWNSSDLRKDLIRKGRERKNFFSWDKTADHLWKSVTKVL